MSAEQFPDYAEVWAELPEPMRGAAQAVHAATPPHAEVEACLNRLALLSPAADAGRTLPGPKDSSPARPRDGLHKPAARRMWRLGGALAALTAGAIALLVLLPPSSAGALEAISRALRGRPCIKMTTTGPDGRAIEHWFFPARNISAWRSDAWIEYRDHETEITLAYDRVEKKLYRTAEPMARRNLFLVDLVESLSSLARNQPVRQIKGMQLVSSRLRTVERNGVEQRELLVKLLAPKQKEPVVATIVLNPEDDLPRTVRATGRLDDEEQRLVVRFDYPEMGPHDIYALGTPREADLIDRIPATDVKRLVAGVEAGRTRFDDYRAIVLSGTDQNAVSRDSHDVMMIAKRGPKLVYLRAALPLSAELAAKSRDELANVLLGKADSIRWYPVAVWDGPTHYWFDVRFQYAADGKQTIEISAVHRYEYTGLAGEEVLPPSWHCYPHLVGRPPLGIGRQDIAGSIATELEGGPDGCVLLEVRRSGRVSEAPQPADDRTSRFNRGGYWIRPDRDFLVLQDDSAFDNEQSYRFVLDKLARSPQGNWYPVKAHRDAALPGRGEVRTEHYTYHVDFAARPPEELFDPQRYLGKR